MKLFLILFAFGWMTSSTPAQVALRGPVLGSVYVPGEASVRPILGIAGAATLGEPVPADAAFSKIALSPNGRFALAEVDNDGGVVLWSPFTGDVVPLRAEAGAKRVVFSPTGHSALLYYGENHAMLLIGGLPAKPEVRGGIDMTWCGGEVAAIALSDDLQILAGVIYDDGGALYSIRPHGGFTFLFPLEDPSSISYVAGSNDAIIADRAVDRIYRLRNVAGRHALESLASESDGVTGPLSVGVSRSGAFAFALNSGGTITRIDLVDGKKVTVDCSCEATALEQLAGNAVLRIRLKTGASTLLLDGGGGEPRVMFVPEVPRTIQRSPRTIGRGRK